MIQSKLKMLKYLLNVRHGILSILLLDFHFCTAEKDGESRVLNRVSSTELIVYWPAQVDQVLSDLFGVGKRRRGSDVTTVLLMLTVVHDEDVREFVLMLVAALHVFGVRDP